MKLAVATVLLLAADARAECVAYGMVAKAVVPPAALPADGGILVYSEPVVAAPDNIPAWKWKTGGAITYKTLAPGLGIYTPNKAGVFELIDAKSTTKVKATFTTEKRALLDAPKPKAVVFVKRIGRRGGEDVFVELDAPPPAATVAVVVLEDSGRRRSFRWLTDHDATSISVYSISGCLPLPNGTLPTKVGDLVKVAFVDDAGRMSPPSKAFKVQAKPSLAPP